MKVTIETILKSILIEILSTMVPYKPKMGKIRKEKNKGYTKMEKINRNKNVIKTLDFT